MNWSRCVFVGLFVGAFIPCAANAWKADGFRSGMALAEALAILTSHGGHVHYRSPLRGAPKNAHAVSSKSGSFELHGGATLTFWSDVLYGYNRDLPGGFRAFVTTTAETARRLGAPTFDRLKARGIALPTNSGVASMLHAPLP